MIAIDAQGRTAQYAITDDGDAKLLRYRGDRGWTKSCADQLPPELVRALDDEFGEFLDRRLRQFPEPTQEELEARRRLAAVVRKISEEQPHLSVAECVKEAIKRTLP